MFSCSGKQGYLCGFFFWLDLGSTITLILDLTYALSPLSGRPNKDA